MVSMKLFEQFLEDMQAEGRTVLLCGVRADFDQAMQNLRFEKLLPAKHVFFETNGSHFSSTIQAVRHGYELLGPHGCAACAGRDSLEAKSGALHYMI